MSLNPVSIILKRTLKKKILQDFFCYIKQVQVSKYEIRVPCWSWISNYCVFNVVIIWILGIFLNVSSWVCWVLNFSSNLPYSLCPIFFGNVPALLNASITKILRKSILVAVQKMPFYAHIDTTYSEIFRYVVYDPFVIVSSIVFKKVLNNLYKRWPCS